jgi:hypothetical protein
MDNNTEDKWLICKRYVHMDLPYTHKQYGKARAYVTNPDKVAHHAFLPLIRRVVKTFPYRQKNGKPAPKKKVRNLTFASHFDAAIYGYYSKKLQDKYEEYLIENDIADVVTAYRKIPSERQDTKSGKCNIDFAYEVFSYISEQLKNRDDIAVITFDIKGFFDNLDHKIIKKTWQKVLGVNNMSDDLFAVYKSVTSYSFVYETELFNKFKDSIYCKDKQGDIVKRKVADIHYLRQHDAIAFCQKEDIKKIRKSHLIKTRSNDANGHKGIPQGLPISATLANVYMIDFDSEAKGLLKSVGGIYRRYSDDIIVVCPKEVGENVKSQIMQLIGNVHLEIEERKTNLFYFSKFNNRIKCEHSVFGPKKDLEYLGFSFDGNRILIKKAGVCKFYYKMYQATLRHIRYGQSINNPTRGVIFKGSMIKRYTYAGSKPHTMHLKSSDSPACNVKHYGNYLSYVRKSEKLMGGKTISRQLRHAPNKLGKLIKFADFAMLLDVINRLPFQKNNSQ